LLKCTNFDFRWCSAPDPLGSLQRSPDPLAVFKGPTSTNREGTKRGDRREGKERRLSVEKGRVGWNGGDERMRAILLRKGKEGEGI